MLKKRTQFTLIYLLAVDGCAAIDGSVVPDALVGSIVILGDARRVCAGPVRNARNEALAQEETVRSIRAVDIQPVHAFAATDTPLGARVAVEAKVENVVSTVSVHVEHGIRNLVGHGKVGEDIVAGTSADAGLAALAETGDGDPVCGGASGV